MLLALLGGGIAWGLIVAYDPWFTIPEDLRDVTWYSPPDKIAQLEAALEQAVCRNTYSMLAAIGALLGGLVALGDGLARRSAARALFGLPVGAVTGSLAAAAGGWLGQAVIAAYGGVTAETELFRTTYVHIALLAPLGAGVGLGLGLLGGRCGALVRMVVGGILGGVFAAIVYPISAAFLLPGDITETLIPWGPLNRLLWIGLAAALIGLCVPGMRFHRKPE
jgi:hypothetical protein